MSLLSGGSCLRGEIKLEGIKSIAITGKGGTGKTMLATLMIKILTENIKAPVLVIDADSAMSLPYTLGISISKTVSDLRRDIIGYQQFQRQMDSQPMRKVMKGLLESGRGFDLLVMGRPEEPGCFCAVNDLLRYGIDILMKDYMVTIIDGEAGPEQLNRRVLNSIDILLVVADMSARSLITARTIMAVAQVNGNVSKTGLILNRVLSGDKYIQKISDETGLEILGCIPEDKMINDFDRSGRSLLDLPDDSTSCHAVRHILQQIIPEVIEV